MYVLYIPDCINYYNLRICNNDLQSFVDGSGYTFVMCNDLHRTRNFATGLQQAALDVFPVRLSVCLLRTG